MSLGYGCGAVPAQCLVQVVQDGIAPGKVGVARIGHVFDDLKGVVVRLLFNEIVCAFAREQGTPRAECGFGSQWLLCQTTVEFFVAVHCCRTIILHPLPWNGYSRCG